MKCGRYASNCFSLRYSLFIQSSCKYKEFNVLFFVKPQFISLNIIKSRKTIDQQCHIKNTQQLVRIPGFYLFFELYLLTLTLNFLSSNFGVCKDSGCNEYP